MKFLIFAAVLISFDSFACWKLKALLSVNSEELLVEQKVVHDKTYSFLAGPYIFNVRIPSGVTASGHLVKIDVVEKVGMTLTPVSTTQFVAETGREAKFTKIDEKTKQLTTVKLTLNEI